MTQLTDGLLQEIVRTANTTKTQIERVYVFTSACTVSDTREAFAFKEKQPRGTADGG